MNKGNKGIVARVFLTWIIFMIPFSIIIFENGFDFAAIYPLLEGGGEVVFAQLLDGPLPAASEGVLGQGLASQVVFHLRK